MFKAVLLLAALVLGASLTPESTVLWAEVKTHVDGTPCVIGGYQLAIVADPADLNTAGVTPLALIDYGPAAWTGLGVKQLVAGLPSGTYRLQARAKNGSGVWSAWSAPLVVTWDTSSPASPTGLTIRG